MGEAANQIESYIENTRQDLGSNLQELENKVRSATDWKQQFRKNPMTMVGLAFGGGALMAAMLGGKGHRRYSGVTGESHTPHAGTDRQAHKALETWDNIKGALIAVAATRFKDYVGDVIPGFQEQYRKTEDPKGPSSSVSPPLA
jgi:uncharacterized membrane protein YebE (DUF533 family)